MRKRSSTFFILLGLVTGLLAVYISLSQPGRMPVMLKTPEGAAECAADLMDALRDGDYEAIEAALYGNPGLGMDPQPQSAAGKLIYPLYRQSLSYSFRGEPWVTDSGISLGVTVTALDTGKLAEMLAANIPPEEAERPESWSDALAQIPEYPQRTHSITLNLVREQNQWWILPEEPLLNVISGTME